MAKAWPALRQTTNTAKRLPDWPKAMSDNIAYALLVYTGLQIFLTVQAIKGKDGSMLPYLALIVLIAAIIPACRAFERRWQALDETQSHDPAMAPLFQRQRALLWLAAIGIPLAMTGLCAVFSSGA